MSQPGFRYTVRPAPVVNQVAPPTTERLLIIGQAVDGPVNTPILARDGQTVQTLFGPTVYMDPYKDPVSSDFSKAFNGNYLVQGYAQAVQAGATNIYLVRVGGTYASGGNGTYIFKSKYPGRLYNEVTVTPTTGVFGGSNGVQLVIVQPTNKGGTVTYRFEGTDTIEDLRNKLDVVATNTCVQLDVNGLGNLSNPCSALVASLSNATITLANGTNGTNVAGELGSDKSSIYSLITSTDSTALGTFSSLLDFQFDVGVMAGLYIDDQVTTDASSGTTSFASAFAVFIDTVSNRTRPCYGVIGCRPIKENQLPRMIRFVRDNYLDGTAGPIKWDGVADYSARWIKAGYFVNKGFTRLTSNNEVLDMGARLTVFAGPDFLYQNPQRSLYPENGAVTFAAYLTTIGPERSPLSQRIPGIVGIANPFPQDIADNLVSGIGWVSATDVPGSGAYACAGVSLDLGGPVFLDDPTMVQDRVNSPLINQQAVHVVNAAAKGIRTVSQPFIGLGNNEILRTALATQIRSQMDKLVAIGALAGPEGVGYIFAVTVPQGSAKLGIINISLSLQPAFSIRQINVNIEVRQ